MIYIYQGLLLIVSLLLSPFILLWILILSDAKIGLNERFAIYPESLKTKLRSLKDPVWVHAASVGEIKVLEKFRAHIQNDLFITCTTSAGRKLALESFPQAVVLMAPVDFIFLTKKLIKISHPQKLYIIETELWPGLIHAARNMEIHLLNARISDKTYSLYKKFSSLFSVVLLNFNSIWARDFDSYERFLALGADKAHLNILGDMKFLDSVPALPDDARYEKVEYPVIVCGSIRKNEAEILIDTYIKLKDIFPELVMILSPRHLYKVRSLKRKLDSLNIKSMLWTELDSSLPSSTVIIVDTMGELSKIYSLASIVFIGGSFSGDGGQNVIEALMWSKALLIGPSIYNFKYAIDLFEKAGALKIVRDREELYKSMEYILNNKDIQENMGKIAIDVFQTEKEQLAKRIETAV